MTVYSNDPAGILRSAVRREQWLELEWPPPPESAGGPLPKAGSHPHEVRQWLLASSLFPAKWVNRLFSVGGIRWEKDRVRLLAFPAADTLRDPLYASAKLTGGDAGIRILYEDDYCIVADKPAGMPVHASRPGQTGTLDEAVAGHMLAKGDPLPVRHIHRLDEDTSGPVLYSTNDMAHWRLDEAMRAKAIDRRYIAVVEGRLRPAAGRIDLPIGKDRHHGSRRRVTPNGDAAVTHYETVSCDGRLSLVRIRLETGRTHQIRVHMSHLGHPLIGDKLYGGSAELLDRQALHGERLQFAHPLTGDTVEVEAPWPDWLDRLAKLIRPSRK